MAEVNVTYLPSGDLQVNTYLDANGSPYVYNLGDMAWILTSTALVFIMVPGVGCFYAGLLRRKNALSMLFLSFVSVAIVTFQWFFWGYSLTFSDTGSSFIGDLRYFALRGVLDAPSVGGTRVPASLYMIYQGMFAAITPAIALGGFAERARLGPMMVFIFVWTTLVYDPIACWTWNPNGWVYKLGGLDFAGGSPVHISSGTAALAISLYLGKRRGYGTERLGYKPHSTMLVILGTVLLWFGWAGFNGGSALSANLRAVSAYLVTNIAASVGGLTWMILDYRLERKWSAVGFCSGVISGLVAITPASGYVGAPAAVAFGFLGGLGCNFATRIKFLVRIDDALDVFASHGVGGVIGNLLTALFAQASVAGLDGFTVIPGGWINQNYIQLAYQLADSVAAVAYSFGMTTLICWMMHFIPFLRLRCSEEAEIIGIDDAYSGEFLYDYVGLDPEARLVHHESGGLAVVSGGERSSSENGKLAPINGGSEKERVGHAGGGRVDV